MARGNRPERVAELVHKELAVLLRSEVKDHRVGLVSITHVEVTRDLSIARVHVTTLGGGGDREAMLAGLKHAAGFLRGRVGRALQLRHAPQLDFRLDEHTEHAVQMTSMLNRMEHERAEAESAEPGEE